MLLGISMSLGLSSCFKDPTGTEIPDPKPFAVSMDSLSVQLNDYDDVSGSPKHQYVLSNRATIAGTRDSSFIVIDTSGAVPLLTMHVYLTPRFDNESDARECKLHQVCIEIDSEPIVGEGWKLFNNAQFSVVVRTSEKPQPQYTRVHITQNELPPYTKEDNFASIFAWKVTAKKQIVLRSEFQLNYAVNVMSRVVKDHLHASSEFRLKY